MHALDRDDAVVRARRKTLLHVSIFELVDRRFRRLFRLVQTTTVDRIPWSVVEPRDIQENEASSIR